MYYVNKVLAFVARNVKKLIILAAIMIIIALAATFTYDIAYNFVRGDDHATYDKNGETIMLTIPKGSNSEMIANLLEEKGVIDNADRFRLRAKLMGAENDFKYGTYSFIVGMSDETIIGILESGTKQEGVKITIPEGWTLEQIGDYLQKEEICLKEDFLKACNATTYDFDYYTDDMLSGTSERRNLLEGYLFPNTYEIVPEEGAEGVVRRLLREFERKYSDSMRERTKELGLTVDQVMTMASVIEKEAQLAEDRSKVAAVLYNRMEQKMPWQLNSTVLYALGIESEGEDALTYDDLEIDSGYNTYKYDGYPTGPICCPGMASIEAVLYPEDIDAIYFILNNDGSGSHLFTADYEEFLAVKGGE